MSYMYRAKPGEKGYWKGQIFTNNGDGKAKKFRSDKKLKEFDKSWYELVSSDTEATGAKVEATASVDAKTGDEGDNGDDKSLDVDPNKVIEAYDQMDHGDDDQWNKDGSPKIGVLNGFYKEGTLKAADIKELNLKRVKAE